MLKHCVKAVNGFVKNYGRTGKFSSLSTKSRDYLTSKVIFIPSFHTASEHSKARFKQPQSCVFNLLIGFLTPSSTSPIIETKSNILEGVFMTFSFHYLPSTICFPFSFLRFHRLLINVNSLQIANCKLSIAAPKGDAS